MDKPIYQERREEAVQVLRHIADLIECGALVQDITIENILVRTWDGILINYKQNGWRKLSMTWFNGAEK